MLAAACSQSPPSAPTELPDDLLSTTADFVEVPRSSPSGIGTAAAAIGSSSSVTVQDGDHNFYLAIRKDMLAQRWFLSAYAKQWFPGDVNAVAAATLGTRVVSFKEQNGKLFIFDTSDQFHTSDLLDPTILVEAWPIVDLPAFDRLRDSDRFVLVDPSAGLNKFVVTGDTFGDPTLSGSLPFRVGLAFMQNFHGLADGAAFEEVFTGDILGGVESAWGTLGISLRKYFEGKGFTQAPEPDAEFFFLSADRIVPGTNGGTEATPVHFNFHKGMQPIEVIITEGAFRAQADFPDFDVLGAFKRGVETWNDVFGFPVFKAKFVHSDAIPDDDKSFVLVDYPGGAGFAFADWRSNPNTGETRGMSVYFSGQFFQDFDFFADDPPEGGRPVQAKPATRTLGWGGMPAKKATCTYWSPRFRKTLGSLKGDSKRTAQEKGNLFIQHVLAHEVGHTLGLRHNFAGSLEPPSSSLMDYLNDFTEALELANPGPYDREAIQFLYGLSPNQPDDHFFCNDGDVSFIPQCQLFDAGADPLNDFWAGDYSFLVTGILGGRFAFSNLDNFDLNEILEFARDTGFVPASERTDAVAIALDRAAVPVSAADAASPAVVARINRLAQIVLSRIALDSPDNRGFIVDDVSDPGVQALVAAQAGGMVRNDDLIRSMPLRRTAVDVLKALQADPAFLELKKSQDVLEAKLAGGTLSADEVPFVEDLLARINSALSPYFN